MTRYQREVVRKAVHGGGFFFLPVLLWNRTAFTVLVCIFLIVYLIIEWGERRGFRIPGLTQLTEISKRESESGKISRGAIYLVLSSLVLPYLFGAHAAAIGLAQIYTADVTSTLIGIRWGKRKLPYSPKKSWLGSAAFLVTAFAASLFFIPWPQALLLAFLGTVVESLPIREADNLTVPLAVSLVSFFII